MYLKKNTDHGYLCNERNYVVGSYLSGSLIAHTEEMSFYSKI